MCHSRFSPIRVRIQSTAVRSIRTISTAHRVVQVAVMLVRLQCIYEYFKREPSAIVACRGAVFGLGGDVGGSIRMPSLFCGIKGIKPSHTRMTQVIRLFAVLLIECITGGRPR